MKGKRRYQNKAREFAQRKESKSIIFSGSLGITTGGKNVVDIEGRPGFVWVQLRNQLNETIQAFNESVSPVFELPVQVEWDGRSYRVLGRDVGLYTVWGGGGSSTSSYLPAHGASHSFDTITGWGGGDVVWVYGQQFMPLLITPSGSAGAMSVYSQPASYYYNSQFHWSGGTGIVGFDGMRPTGSANARMLLVYLNPNTGNILIHTGSMTEFSNTITGSAQVLPYVPALKTSTDIPLAGVRLVTGTSSLLWTNIYDLRDHFVHSAASTGTATSDISVRIYKSSAQAIPNNTGTAILFNSERYDTDSMHSGSSSQIYFNRAGKYLITGNASFATNATGRRSLGIRLNKTATIGRQQVRSVQSGGPTDVLVTTQYGVNAGDYVELVAFQTSGGNLNVISTGSYSPEFMAQKMG